MQPLAPARLVCTLHPGELSPSLALSIAYLPLPRIPPSLQLNFTLLPWRDPPPPVGLHRPPIL